MATDLHGLSTISGADHREDSGECFQIVTGRVEWLTVFFDGAQQFSHGTAKAVVEPFAFELGGGYTFLCFESYFVDFADSARRIDNSLGAGDRKALEIAMLAMAVESERCETVGKLDKGTTHHGGL